MPPKSSCRYLEGCPSVGLFNGKKSINLVMRCVNPEISQEKQKNLKILKLDHQLKVKISHRSQSFGWKLPLERLKKNFMPPKTILWVSRRLSKFRALQR